MDFINYKSVQNLKNLSKTSVDLTGDGFLTPQRIKSFKSESCGLEFFYGLEKVNEDVLKELFNLAKESHCLEKMYAMQSGEVINFIKGFESENRKVLHTATRDFFEDRMKELEAEKAADLAYAEVEKLKVFVDELDKEDKFKNVVQIGIGGSVLGPQSMCVALESFSSCKVKRKAYFISNVDPDEIALLVKTIDLKETLVISVSKSGSTLETLTNEEFLKSFFGKEGLDPKGHFIAVTSKGSLMDNLDNYLNVFYLWDYVGGRFSSTSMVGGVILSLTLGFDVYVEFLRGANKVDKTALSNNINDNLPLLAALIGIWNRNFLNYSSVCIVPYSSMLSNFCLHLQQCVMESNGKSIDNQGREIKVQTSPLVWGSIGTNAQHSFFQYLHQGTDIAPVMFIGFRKSQYEVDLEVKNTTSQQKLMSNLIAQAIALAVGKKDSNPNKNFVGNRPSSIILAKKLTPFTFGALMAFFEHKTAFEGFILGINSFDQEGVQLGKVLANKMMKVFAKEEIDFPLGKAFI